MWVLASRVWERWPGPLPLSVDVRRWLVGRNAGRTGQHLTAGVVTSLGILVVVGATVALEAYPEYAQWYEVTALSATTLAAGTQVYQNDDRRKTRCARLPEFKSAMALAARFARGEEPRAGFEPA